MCAAKVHQEMGRRKMGSEESCRLYFIRMKELETRGKLTDEDIMYYIVREMEGDEATETLKLWIEARLKCNSHGGAR